MSTKGGGGVFAPPPLIRATRLSHSPKGAPRRPKALQPVLARPERGLRRDISAPDDSHNTERSMFARDARPVGRALTRWNPGGTQEGEKWSGRLDSNQRPPAPKAGALPGCATPRHRKPLDSTAFSNGACHVRFASKAKTVPKLTRPVPKPPRFHSPSD
jgi:hypothetical protein